MTIGLWLSPHACYKGRRIHPMSGNKPTTSCTTWCWGGAFVPFRHGSGAPDRLAFRQVVAPCTRRWQGTLTTRSCEHSRDFICRRDRHIFRDLTRVVTSRASCQTLFCNPSPPSNPNRCSRQTPGRQLGLWKAKGQNGLPGANCDESRLGAWRGPVLGVSIEA